MAARLLRLRKRIVRWLLPLLRVGSPRTAARLLDGFGRVEHDLLPAVRRRQLEVVKKWSWHFGCDWDVARVSRDLAGNEARWRARDILLDGLDERKLDRLVRVQGRDRLDAALAQGRGVVLLANHYGSHLVPSHWLIRKGYPLRLYMERPHHVSKLLGHHLKTDGPLGQAGMLISRKRSGSAESAAMVLRAVKVLRAGMVLCLAGDVRWTGPNTVPARFLGEELTFTNTWVVLAALSGAPVVPVFCRMARNGAYDLEFRPSFTVPSDAIATGQVPRYVQAFLDTVEEQLRNDPTNGNEYALWAEATVPKSVAG
jgi:KDO2-lipid IV(A) lauroyltransferase